MATFTEMIGIRPPSQVKINLNAISGDGLVRVRTARADGPVEVGQLVRIVEPTDEIEGIAKVARINHDTGLMYLDVRWNSLRDLPPLVRAQAVEQGFSPIFRRPISAIW